MEDHINSIEDRGSKPGNPLWNVNHLASFPELDPAPIVELDTGGNISYSNPAASNLFPGLEEQGVRHPFLVGGTAVFEFLKQRGLSKTTREIQVDKSWYEQTIYCVNNGANCRFYGRDITHKKPVEQMKDRFISLISHELRSPLTVMVGSIHVARRAGLTGEQLQKLLAQAEYSARGVDQILENLLQLAGHKSRPLTLTKEHHDIARVIEHLVERESAALQWSEVVFDVQAGASSVVVDRMKIEQVLRNLLGNASRYAPPETSITVTVRNHDQDNVLVGITDAGKGISEEYQRELFPPFEKAEEVAEKTGGLAIGLIVCKQLIEAHGGQIWVESTPGQGTTFWFTLPTN